MAEVALSHNKHCLSSIHVRKYLKGEKERDKIVMALYIVHGSAEEGDKVHLLSYPQNAQHENMCGKNAEKCEEA